MTRKNILILDPERDIGEFFARVLEARKDCRCYLPSKQEEALSLLKDLSIELLLIDLTWLMAGDFTLLRKIKSLSPNATIVVVAYLHQQEHVGKALERGARGHIIKPIKLEELRRKMDQFYGLQDTH